MKASELIQQLENQILYPAGVNRPTFDVLKADINDSTKTILLEDRLSGKVPRHAILQCEFETWLNSSTAGENLTLAERGYLESDPVAHPAGARVEINPKFLRSSAFVILQSVIGQLYSYGVYHRDFVTTLDYTTTGVVSLADPKVKRIVAIAVRKSGAAEDWIPLRPGWDYRVLPYFSTLKIKFAHGGIPGHDLQIVVAKDFTKPASVDDDLTADCGVPEDLAPYLTLPVAGYLLRGTELPKIQIDEIRRAVASMGVQVPAGTTTAIADALERIFRERFVANTARRQREEDPIAYEYVGTR